MILLDTDHISFLQRPESREGAILQSRMAATRDLDFAVTVISVFEQLKGWLNLIGRYKDLQSQVVYFARLEQFIRFFEDFEIVHPNDVAVSHFERLRHEGVRIGASDLKIASIAISRDALLLTRNTRDFERVPGLRFADWTI